MKKLFIISVCLFCLSGCTVKIAYNFLGFIFKWEIGKYVSLNSEQKKYLSGELKEFHQWHRETQLPLYADYINKTLIELEAQDIDGPWIHKKVDGLQVLLDNSVNRLKPTIAELMSTMSDKQVNTLLKKLEKKRRKYAKKHVDISPKKQRKARKKELLDYITAYFGKFSEEQKAWIEAWLDEIQTHEHLTLKQQELWALSVEEALKNRHDKAQLAQGLDKIIFYRTDDWDPELQKILDHNQEITYNLLARLTNSRSEKQSKKMFKRLKNFENDFIELHNND